MKNYTINFDDISSKMLLHDALRLLKGVYNVKIERITEKRSNNQNKYFHGVILPYISQEVGDLEINVKEDLRAMFLSTTEVKYGQEITKVRSTASLSTVEFEEFNEKIRTWAAGFLGINIPEPNQIIENIL